MKRLATFRLLIIFTTTLFCLGCSSSGGRVAPQELRSLTVRTRTADPCLGKERCVIGYFAPWCQTTQTNIPFLQELHRQLQDHPRIGSMFIVGDDTEYEIESLAWQIGAPVYLDTSKTFEKSVEFSTIPRFWVLDRERNIIETFSWTGNRADNLPRAARYFLESKLDLEEFLNQAPTDALQQE